MTTQKAVNDYFDSIIEKLELKDKIVIDYGTGGGVFGKKLLEKGIKKYIGYDIAERQIATAKKTLKDFKNKEFHLVEDYPILSQADVFISLAVIQHFPNRKYYEKFFEILNESKIPVLYLQIRHDDLIFNNKKYYSNENVRYACHTNEKDLSERLTNYKIDYVSEIANNKYQHLIFKGV